MKEYKSKLMTTLFWTACGFCAGWFVFNLAGKFTHNILISGGLAIVVIALMLFKIYICDLISIVFTDDNQLQVKRFGKIIKSFILDNYYWSEYSKDSNTKDAEDQDIYYVSKENGEEDSIDCSNFSSDDYAEILTKLGARGQNVPPVKVETIRK